MIHSSPFSHFCHFTWSPTCSVVRLPNRLFFQHSHYTGESLSSCYKLMHRNLQCIGVCPTRQKIESKCQWLGGRSGRISGMGFFALFPDTHGSGPKRLSRVKLSMGCVRFFWHRKELIESSKMVPRLQFDSCLCRRLCSKWTDGQWYLLLSPRLSKM